MPTDEKYCSTSFNPIEHTQEIVFKTKNINAMIYSFDIKGNPMVIVFNEEATGQR